MSVTIEGVKGYEYQYKVTVLIALLYLAKNNELYVEIEGSEDATLKVKTQTNNSTIEIQVKREKNNLNISKLVDWLSHFQELKSDNNLLKRLIDNNETITLFVSRSRCSDEIVKLKTEIGNINTHDNIKLLIKEKEAFIKQLNEKKFGKTSLMKAREAFCSQQANEIENNSNLEQVLKKVLIWEEISDEKIDYEVDRILNLNHSIAQSNTNNIYFSLLELVKKGRDNGKNIIPSLRKIILSNKIESPIITKDYIIRAEEEDLINSLIRTNTLLLTGLSQCGKSELAKKVSMYFFNLGYNYKRIDNIEEVKRFFSSNSNETKVIILEDPWGHINIRENFEEEITEIRDVISNIQQHHKLIITCRREILFEIFQTTTLDNCKIKNIEWHDLTINDKSRVTNFWTFLSESKSFPENITKIVNQNIVDSDNQHLLQIGQLRYLINEDSTELTNKTPKEIERIARRNSNEIARSIKQKNSYVAEILSTLALCITPLYPISFTDLAFILSESEDNGSIQDRNLFSLSSDEEFPFPEYNQEYHLSDKAENVIEYLEERQFITISNDNILFSHPNYLETGRYLLLTSSTIKQRKVLKIVEKCISCLNPVNSHLAATYFSFLFKNFKDSIKDEVINLAFKSFSCIFPSVEDVAMIFLMDLMDTLSNEQAQRLIGKIQNGGTDSSSIYWHEKKVPFITNSNRFRFQFADRENIKKEVIKHELSLGKLPNPYEIWTLIGFYFSNTLFNIKMYETLLLYKEAFIRAKVAYLAMCILTNEKEPIIEKIFNDKHPKVIFNAIRAIFSKWFNYSDPLKKHLFYLVKLALNKKQVAIKSYNLISSFSAYYSSEGIIDLSNFSDVQKKEIWNRWGEMYVITVANLPLHLRLHSPRFGATMDDAMKYIDLEIGIQVLEAWYKRIDYQIKHGKSPDEFELAISDSLVDLTKYEHSIRREFFMKLTIHENTSFLLSSIKWFISKWRYLSDEEKKQIVDLVNSERRDVCWIKTMLLCSFWIPDEISLAILKLKNIPEHDISFVLTKFSDELLLNCLRMYTGLLEPSIGVGFNHCNTDFWNDVIRYILKNENHIGFDISLEEFVNKGVNGFSTLWKDGITLWEEICNITTNKDKLTMSLIYNTARCTCTLDTTNSMWKLLIKSYTDKGQETKVISLIIENLEILRRTGRPGDIVEIFEKDFLLDKVLPKLIPDSYTSEGIKSKVQYELGITRDYNDNDISKLYKKSYFIPEDWIGLEIVR